MTTPDLVINDGNISTGPGSIAYSGPYFTSVAEMKRTYSTIAVTKRVDDFNLSDPEQANTLQEIIIRATYRAKAILNKIFADSALATHPWVRERVTYIACYLLSIRKGNDSQYFNNFLEAFEDFQDLVNGTLYLDDLPSTIDSLAVMCNVSSDNRYPFTPMRVDTLTAVPNANGVKFVHRYIPFTWY